MSSSRAGRVPSLKSVLGSGAANALARGVGLVAGLVTIPFVASALTPEEFGLYLTLTTVFLMLSALDFGIGGAVLSQISASAARADRRGLFAITSSAVAALTVAASLLVLVGGLVAMTLSLRELLGVRTVPEGTVVAAVVVTLIATALSLPLSVAGRALFGVHRGHLTSGIAGAASLGQMAVLILCAQTNAPLVAFVLAGTSAVLLTGLVTTALVGRLSAGALRVVRSAISTTRVRALAREGGPLFVLAMVGVIAFQTDTLIIAHFLGSGRVPDYAIPFRIFGLLPLLAGLFLTPLWAAYRDGRERGRAEWLQRTLRRTIIGSAAVATMIVLILIPMTPQLLRVWVGDEVLPPSVNLRLALASYVVVVTVSAAASVYLNAMGMLRIQAMLGIVMATSNVGLSVVMVQSVGIAGPVWATVLTQGLIVMIPSLWLAFRGQGATASVEDR